ncbi:MAG TPA: putative toxin-antitoxin system toxin component, PIN family [Phycisphaerae bacterium]|nr:putative toxin-antitoxin system toxin component, PIN family [Phycisphaerae bacterium]
MSDGPLHAVLDCMVFAQTLINPRGPAGECIERGSRGEFLIVVSPAIVTEILELPRKLPSKFAITDDKINAFMSELLPSCVVVHQVPHVFDHPIDPDDSPYVDLAIAASAELIVSRDRHLLGLNDPRKPWSADFRSRFPSLRIIVVEELLHLLKNARDAGPAASP